MTLQEMKDRKTELGYTNEQIARLSGVPLPTVVKIFSGTTKAPRRNTIQALEKVLQREPVPIYPGHRVNPMFLREGAAAYGKVPNENASGEKYSDASVLPSYGHVDSDHSIHTVEDYWVLPDDVRVELIDGKFFRMESPSVNHQLVIGEISMQLKLCEKAHPGSCRVIFAPFDVQLDCDRYTMLQPDIIVICDADKLKKGLYFGAPDLIMEILSPSTKKHDSVLKLRKYKDAGVREYWLIDPERKKIIVYHFGDSNIVNFYDFTDNVPVGISDGKCVIDFREVERAMIEFPE